MNTTDTMYSSCEYKDPVVIKHMDAIMLPDINNHFLPNLSTMYPAIIVNIKLSMANIIFGIVALWLPFENKLVE